MRDKFSDDYWTIDKQMERAADPDNQITGGGGGSNLTNFKTENRMVALREFSQFRISGSVEVPLPNVTLICANCGKSFEGRPNRLHCSVVCRRSLEFARREWERRALIVRFYERNSNSEYLNKRQREHWRQQFESAQAKLPPRP